MDSLASSLSREGNVPHVKLNMDVVAAGLRKKAILTTNGWPIKVVVNPCWRERK